MTNINPLDNEYTLPLLRWIRERSGPQGDSVNTVMYLRMISAESDVAASDLMIGLRDAGLVQNGRQGAGWTTTTECDRLLDAIDAEALSRVIRFEPCPFTHAHTREWCGRDYCRES